METDGVWHRRRLVTAAASVRADVRSASGGSADLTLIPGTNLQTGHRELAMALGVTLSSLEDDLLTLAAAVYACDLAARRDAREGACRTVELAIPVVNRAALQAVVADIVYALHLLSRDTWRIHLQPAPGAPEGYTPWPDASGSTLLFSGGLEFSRRCRCSCGVASPIHSGQPLHSESGDTTQPRRPCRVLDPCLWPSSVDSCPGRGQEHGNGIIPTRQPTRVNPARAILPLRGSGGYCSQTYWRT